MAEAQKTLRVTQIKSSIGYKKDQLATLKSLGLGKIGRSHDLVDNESVRGMISDWRAGHRWRQSGRY